MTKSKKISKNYNVKTKEPWEVKDSRQRPVLMGKNDGFDRFSML